MNCKYKPKKLFVKGYDYSMWSKHEDILNVKEESLDLSDMSHYKVMKKYKKKKE